MATTEDNPLEMYPRRKLNSLYRAIPLEDKVFIKLRKYFLAMSILYGIIPLRKAFEIISEQNPGMITKDEFLAFSEIARHEEDMYYIIGEDELYSNGKLKSKLDRELVDFGILYRDDDLAAYEMMKSLQGNKPYYVPNQTKLFTFGNILYEKTSYTQAMVDFLRPMVKEDAMVEMIVASCSDYVGLVNSPFRRAFELLDEKGVVLSEKDAEKFVSLCQDIHNNTRMQVNRGYTPNEIVGLYKDASPKQPHVVELTDNTKKALAEGRIDPQDIILQLMTADMPSEEIRAGLLRGVAEAISKNVSNKSTEKVGRNDPCPCGSGKKYKKCCGR